MRAGCCSVPRSEIDSYTEFVKIYGAKGLAYIKVNELARGREGLQSPIVKNLSDEELNGILTRVGAKDGDIVFFGADKAKVVWDSLGALRLKIGHSDFGVKTGLFTPGWKPLWVINFPMFEYSKKISAGWPATIRSPARSTATRTSSSRIPNTAMPRHMTAC